MIDQKDKTFLIMFIISFVTFFVISAILIGFFVLEDVGGKDRSEDLSISEINEIYNIPTSPAVPAEISTDSKDPVEVVPAGYYKISRDTKEIYVTRTVSDEKNVRLITGSGSGVFGNVEVENLVFINNENTTSSYESLKELAENPVVSKKAFNLKESNSAYSVRFDDNTSGFLCYTLVSSSSTNSVTIDDGAKHIQVSLPDNKKTESYIFGRNLPSPDSITERPEEKDILLVWENSRSGVAVQFFGANVPLYTGITALILLILSGIVLINYRVKMKEARNVMKYVDPDGNSGFRKRR